ncbi:MAG TPA: DUF6602 domain-containing protein [Tepidisphaeraceae bacterium]
MQRSKHIGAEAFLAQRDYLLAKYDHAKKLAVDDPVKTEHGVVGEAIVRELLQQFLPKRYGVTKGYIITHSLEYEGPIEEWDIIIYDRLESPVLFVKESPESTVGGQRLAIPVEHVRGVVEVKATFRPDMANKMREKLLKLNHFVGTEVSDKYPVFLKQPFTCTGIFFETDLTDNVNFRAALDELTPLTHSGAPPFGFLILRSQTAPNHCAYLKYLFSEVPMALGMELELSSELTSLDGKYWTLGCAAGWGVNFFPDFMFDLAADLSGNLRHGRASSFYGFNLDRAEGSRLFPSAVLKTNIQSLSPNSLRG